MVKLERVQNSSMMERMPVATLAGICDRKPRMFIADCPKRSLFVGKKSFDQHNDDPNNCSLVQCSSDPMSLATASVSGRINANFRDRATEVLVGW